jgi:hypothetical protein
MDLLFIMLVVGSYKTMEKEKDVLYLEYLEKLDKVVSLRQSGFIDEDEYWIEKNILDEEYVALMSKEGTLVN